METKSCILAGCAQNIAAQLPTTLEKIEQIRARFKLSAIVIAEDNSIDDTKSILATYASSHANVHILTLDKEVAAYNERAAKLAFLRNSVMSFIHTHGVYSSFDYILLVDMDGLLDKFDPTTLEQAFDPVLPKWDALFANADGRYYDIWALRSDEIGPAYDCWDMYRHLMIQHGLPSNYAQEFCVTRFQKQIDPSRPLIRVQSAFGGMGLYRLAATVGCKYSGVPTYCSCEKHGIRIIPHIGCKYNVCEHVSFHDDMRRLHGADLYIHPGILVTTQEGHLVAPLDLSKMSRVQ